ncbi:MAG: hypothetical protein PVF46_03875, partial [Lysobacterales bacterium]
IEFNLDDGAENEQLGVLFTVALAAGGHKEAEKDGYSKTRDFYHCCHPQISTGAFYRKKPGKKPGSE